MSHIDQNLTVYNDPRVVAEYAAWEGLTDSEVYVFDKYVTDGTAILDIGVGGGRTTPYLSRKASRYVGIDYSQAMIAACKKKFPELEFHCDNAMNLRRFEDATFDIVVFSFNGIDNIRSVEERRSCFREVNRILKPGGRFIFSSHNAKALREWPRLDDAGILKKVVRITRALYKTPPFAKLTLCSGVFKNGSGYILDPAHGGLVGFYSTPEYIAAEAHASSFEVEEVVNHGHGHYPRLFRKYFIIWYYYALVKL